jgi:hypothetical protein
MLPEIKYNPVNWVDGMKISRNHFVDFENAVHDHLRDATGINLTSYSYGLLPSNGNGPASIELLISSDYSQQLNVQLLTCRAVTNNGCRIELLKSQPPLVLTTSASALIATHQLGPAKDQFFYVVLSIQPFSRVPSGLPIMEELPPRHPFTLPTYALHLLPVGQVKAADFGAFHLVIGKLCLVNNELKAVIDYIPACTSVMSFPLLVNWYHHFGQVLSEIEVNSFKIIQKVKTRTQKSTLADSIHLLAEKLVFALANNIIAYKWLIPQQPPIAMVEFLLRLVQNIKAVMECLTDKDREELLAYLAEWSDLTPAVIEHKLNTSVNLQYNHLEIASLLTEVDGFFRIIAELFTKLSQLEFIGKKKGQGVFIIENPVDDPTIEKPKPRWSPL